ncbi:MAG: saccharopine dehydrogenase NADP-binding domain-containing protein [archaeon GB-1867-005]|nr:saccharopine dehydrogenase NADP-binding domain-containing protein [Candidatus Culexmicrobium cathedralense]
MSNDVVLIGFGRIGFAVALDFFNSNMQLTVVDSDPHRLKYAVQVFGFNVLDIDASNLDELERVKRFNLAVVALPGSIAFRVLNKLVDLGLNVVDVSYFPEDPWILHELAVERNVTLIVDAGFAPGLSNIVLGYFHSKFGGLKKARIYVGGLARDSSLPLGLVATWSVEDLIDEYIRRARAIIGGKIVEVDPLSLTGEVTIPKLGVYEYFASDGIRTMLKTFEGVEELIEYTLRYPGHLQIMRMLKKLGFLSDEEVLIGDFRVKLSKVLASILERKLIRDAPDRAIMYIEAESRNGVTRRYLMDVEYDYDIGLSAMGKVTGFTQSNIVKMLLNGRIQDKGLVPPELIGMNLKLYDEFMRNLGRKGIKVLEIS